MKDDDKIMENANEIVIDADENMNENEETEEDSQ